MRLEAQRCLSAAHQSTLSTPLGPFLAFTPGQVLAVVVVGRVGGGI